MGLILCFLALPLVFDKVSTERGKLTVDGDIILGALFPIHTVGKNERECGEFSGLVGYQYMEAMLYTLDKINRQKDFLPGIKLGSIIYDTCRSNIITADKTKEFIKMTLVPSRVNGSEFAGVIGTFVSETSVIVANFLRVFQIPQISYGSVANELSNKNLYNYFLRTVPPDSFFAAALTTFLLKMRWTFVSLLYSSGTWAETGAERLRKVLESNKICLGNNIKIPPFPDDDEFDKIMKTLIGDDEEQPRVVVLYTVQRDSRKLLKAKKRHPRGSRIFFVGSLGWSNRGDITNGLEDIADGTITFGHREGMIPEFQSYFRSLRPSNYSRDYKKWFGEYWQQTYKCKLKNLTIPTEYTNECKDEPNTGYKELAPVQVVINAVQAMANGLNALHQQKCLGKPGLCDEMRPIDRTLLLQFLRNVTYVDAAFHFPVSFNAQQEVDGNYTIYNFRWNGQSSYEYDQVGSWVSKLDSNGNIVGNLLLDESKIRWPNGNLSQPLSTCRPKCARNQIITLREGKCCHRCDTCGTNDIVVNNTCKTCAETHVPDVNMSVCKKLPLHFVNINTPFAVVIVFFSSVGLLFDAIVLGIFLKKTNHKLIKASGREMCYFMLVGIAFIFTVPMISLSKPSNVQCYVERFIMGVSFTVCYAPLLMKMFRIHRIFKHANQLHRLSSSSLIGKRSLLLITTGLIAIQGLFCALVFSTDPPELMEKYYQKRKELVLECDFKKSTFAIYFVYNAVLIVWCTFYAFRTRHFPKNFNEALYIGITMYLTCVVWVVFFATFLNTNYSAHRVYWSSSMSLVIGWITLVGLFFPKIYHVYTKTEFHAENMLTWGETSFPRQESSANGVNVCQHCFKTMEQAKSKRNGSLTEMNVFEESVKQTS
ncbi:metabotropic glutamate receptor 4-like isoform X1 [Xenia sp. Carnegie-2017]|uniref:metabotropic glutamate receptor 4-like isoform X1 n=1 Tax=Xenia sp. Carnegie-2017 TaxID=2897299 RepID=UPI001F046DDA|nr:metabotropic glutamate receptor 4-like isoform X1 [Xenia sp. Carnegie-2017]XP_046852109.1 metabotropic glutamate receptor 4-like isoform X1 [Xenia sp. Carnegie-2017]